MCGVLVVVGQSSSIPNLDESDVYEPIRRYVRCRGPSWVGQARTGRHEGTGLEAAFFSSVLHLRSQSLVKQPFVGQDGSILSWNGELYGGLEGLEDDANDTALLAAALQAADSPDALLK